MHEQKDEHLEVQEGAGLILSSACRRSTAYSRERSLRATDFILSPEWSIV